MVRTHLHPSTNVWSYAGDVVAEHCAPAPPQPSSKSAAPAAPAPTQVATPGKIPVAMNLSFLLTRVYQRVDDDNVAY